LWQAPQCDPPVAQRYEANWRIELTGDPPLNTFGGSLSTGRIHRLWHIIEGALQASGRAGERQVKDVHVSFVGASADRSGHHVHLRQGTLLTTAPRGARR